MHAPPQAGAKRSEAGRVAGPVNGNRRSHLYHAPTCRGAAAMKTENRVEFPSARDAEAAGFKRAGDCRAE